MLVSLSSTTTRGSDNHHWIGASYLLAKSLNKSRTIKQYGKSYFKNHHQDSGTKLWIT
uniref:Uncharacterized protein n=1 Tax=Helianthus annuus TaxID=4232 RepID=A0A251SLK1_HELAN